MARGKKVTGSERRALLATDAGERKKIFKELCLHISAGYSLDCFPPLSEIKIVEFMKTYPLEFVAEDLADAMRSGKEGWEEIGRRQADGNCLGNSRSWYYNMCNRYNWHEKAQIDTKHEGQVTVNVVNYASKKPSSNNTSGLTT